MKDENKRLVETPDNIEVTQFEERLSEYNSFVSDHWLDLLLPDKEFRTVMAGQRSDDEDLDEPSIGDNSERLSRSLDLLFDSQLYRVFNNNSLDEGGRFYGGWWQHIPSQYRHYITIDWYPTKEIDFSNMQAAMLYALEGKSLPGDAYSIEGIDPKYRKLLKRSFFKLINATGRIRPPERSSLPSGWTWKEVMEALRDKHSAIEKHFNTGIGIRLQKTDSEIADMVMWAMREQGKLVLPVHDSFITQEGYAKLVVHQMQNVYRYKMKKDIDVTADASWSEINVTPEAWELDRLGIRYADEAISDLEIDPEFEGYLRRKRDFFSTDRQQWFHTHNAFAANI